MSMKDSSKIISEERILAATEGGRVCDPPSTSIRLCLYRALTLSYARVRFPHFVLGELYAVKCAICFPRYLPYSVKLTPELARMAAA